MNLIEIIEKISEFLLKNKNINSVKFFGEKTNIVIEKDEEEESENKSPLKNIKKFKS